MFGIHRWATLLIVTLASLQASPVFAQEPEPQALSVMTYNVRVSSLYGWDSPGAVWYNTEAVLGNNATSGPHWQTMERGDAAAQTVLDSGADIVGLQEYSNGPADLLGRLAALGGGQWHYADTSAGGILSRYEIAETTDGNYGARVVLPSGQSVWVFNTHYGLHPNWNDSYIPYAARDGHSEQEIIDFVHDLNNWGSTQPNIDADMQTALASGLPVFFTGDFNEPSHLDWTQAAADAGYIPLAVDAPLSHHVIDTLGFTDGYHQDRLNDGETEVSRWGYTWGSDVSGSADDDRIDFVYYQGDGVTVSDSTLIGEANGTGVNGSGDVDLAAWWNNDALHTVSDHRAVAIDFELAPFILGDLTGDGFVGVADLDLLLANWGDSVAAYNRALGDPSGDGVVGQQDLALVLANWSQGTAPDINIPEPGSLMLLGAGCILTARRRRR
ncbi:endonuclease/exonuclease/phosphatase family protein [Phycisphaeraceae bacterium D3-23]